MSMHWRPRLPPSERVVRPAIDETAGLGTPTSADLLHGHLPGTRQAVVVPGSPPAVPRVTNSVLAGTALLAQTQRATATGVEGGLAPLPPEALRC